MIITTEEKTRVQGRIPKSLHKAVKAASAETGMLMQDILSEALYSWLNSQKQGGEAA